MIKGFTVHQFILVQGFAKLQPYVMDYDGDKVFADPPSDSARRTRPVRAARSRIRIGSHIHWIAEPICRAFLECGLQARRAALSGRRAAPLQCNGCSVHDVGRRTFHLRAARGSFWCSVFQHNCPTLLGRWTTTLSVICKQRDGPPPSISSQVLPFLAAALIISVFAGDDLALCWQPASC